MIEVIWKHLHGGHNKVCSDLQIKKGASMLPLSLDHSLPFFTKWAEKTLSHNSLRQIIQSFIKKTDEINKVAQIM